MGSPKVDYMMKQVAVEVVAEADERESTIVWRKNGRTFTLDNRFKQTIRNEGGKVLVTLTVDQVSRWRIMTPLANQDQTSIKYKSKQSYI